MPALSISDWLFDSYDDKNNHYNQQKNKKKHSKDNTKYPNERTRMVNKSNNERRKNKQKYESIQQQDATDDHDNLSPPPIATTATAAATPLGDPEQTVPSSNLGEITTIKEQNNDDSFLSTSSDDDDDDDENREDGTTMPSMSSSTTTTPNLSLQRLVMVAAATAATLGYDVGIMAAAIQPLTATMQLNGVQKEVAMGSLNFVAALGALLGGRIANDKGRKFTVKTCCWFFVVGTIMMAAAPEYWTFIGGRIVTGMGVGVSFVAAPVYLSEVAPTDMRGKLNTVFDVAINGGILLGYVLGFLVELIPNLENHWRWRIMLGLGLVLPLFVLYNLVYLPESPRWLVMVNQSDKAHKVLHDISGGNESKKSIQKMISSMEEELKQEEEDDMNDQMSVISNISTSQLTPLQALGQCRLSKGMRLAIALGFWQQITGTEAVLYYSADFLENAGLESPTERLFGNCFVGVCKLVPELIAMHYVDSIGRRPLMLTSAVSLVASTCLISAAFYLQWSPLIVVIFLCAIMASFSIGIGPFTFLIASESLGLSERATGMTLCAATNRCTSGTVALTAVSMYQALGSSGLFAVYAMVGLCSLPFYYTTVPETAGKTLEEIAAENKADTIRGSIRSGGGGGEVELESGDGSITLSKYSDDNDDDDDDVEIVDPLDSEQDQKQVTKGTFT